MYKAIVIEDERLIRNHISSFINENAESFYVVASLVDGQDALDYIKEHPVDLIVTDIRMLEVSGIEVAKYVYEHNIPTKVVILSGYQDFSYAQEAINYNVQAYLTKPVNPVELQETLKKIKSILDREREQAQPIGELPGDEGNREAEKLMIERALSYMHENFDKDISLKNVADKVYLSEDYFGKLFKKNTGTSFTQYMLSMRM
ncbi:MAG: response regulator, partial [Clostridia bacterium]|nr:response regulator [Clostridia bacterium]